MIMADQLYEVHWLGHMKEGSHDKVWGWLRIDDGRIYAFWGRRGKTLRFKEHQTTYSAEQVARQKANKGYVSVSKLTYDTLVPDFKEELEIAFATAQLSDTIMPI